MRIFLSFTSIYCAADAYPIIGTLALPSSALADPGDSGSMVARASGCKTDKELASPVKVPLILKWCTTKAGGLTCGVYIQTHTTAKPYLSTTVRCYEVASKGTVTMLSGSLAVPTVDLKAGPRMEVAAAMLDSPGTYKLTVQTGGAAVRAEAGAIPNVATRVKVWSAMLVQAAFDIPTDIPITKESWNDAFLANVEAYNWRQASDPMSKLHELDKGTHPTAPADAATVSAIAFPARAAQAKDIFFPGLDNTAFLDLAFTTTLREIEEGDVIAARPGDLYFHDHVASFKLLSFIISESTRL